VGAALPVEVAARERASRGSSLVPPFRECGRAPGAGGPGFEPGYARARTVNPPAPKNKNRPGDRRGVPRRPQKKRPQKKRPQKKRPQKKRPQKKRPQKKRPLRCGVRPSGPPQKPLPQGEPAHPPTQRTCSPTARKTKPQKEPRKTRFRAWFFGAKLLSITARFCKGFNALKCEIRIC
jgi:hypothetical protein